MFARLGHVFFSLLTSRFENVINTALLAVTQEILKKGRQTLFLIISSFVLAVLFAAGVIISLLEASAQYDSRGVIFFTALLSSSLTMTAVSVIGLMIIFWPRNPTIIESSLRPPTLTSHSSPLEDILKTAMIEGFDYFKARQQAKTRSSTREYSQA